MSSSRLMYRSYIRSLQVPGRAEKKAYLVEKGMSGEGLSRILDRARQERENGRQVFVAWMNKNKKFQKEQLTHEGYGEFEEFFRREWENGQ